MKAQRPILHGRDHLPSGADPMLPALPSGTVADIIAATFPGAYYKLNETSGGWADSSGAGRDATYTGEGTRGIAAPLDEGDGSLCAHAAGVVPVPVGGDSSAVGTVTDPFFEFAALVPFTVSALIQPDIVPVSDSNLSMGVCGNVTVTDTRSAGWGLFILSDLSDPDAPGGLYSGVPARVCFRRTGLTGPRQEAVGPPVAAGEWVRVTGVFDGATMGLWLNDDQVASSTATTASLPSGVSYRTFLIGGCGIGEGVGGSDAPFNGQIDSVIVWGRALTSDEIDSIVGSDPTHPVDPAGGLVIGVDDDGNIGWVQPKVDVTVNGEPQTGSTTPLPTPDPPPTDPGTGGPDGDDWIEDQPFTWGGTSFDVPPNKWTTIPFTNPLMERYSNVAGEGTTHTELAWDDPAAAGWIDPATPRAITIPHDMPFLGDPVSWWQICLRIEGPMVAATSSTRALRIFETTHQKALVSAWAEDRESACQEHGAINCYRDSAAPGWTPFDGEIFASGDTGGFDNGNHDTILFVPNSGFAFYLNGNDWLPKVDGVPTLKAGMRLVPQVWHDAPQTLTFHCDGTAPYRPHFVVYQTVQRGWGSPWSDWPTY